MGKKMLLKWWSLKEKIEGIFNAVFLLLIN